jgi:hypothetical protein
MRFAIIFTLLALLAAPVIAQEEAPASLKSPLRGYLVDLFCARERAKEGVTLGEVHTRMCLQMPPCESSGYAVMTMDHQILKFDAKGNDKVKKMLDKTTQNSNFVVMVWGKIDEDEIEVRKIDLVKNP